MKVAELFEAKPDASDFQWEIHQLRRKLDPTNELGIGSPAHVSDFVKPPEKTGYLLSIMVYGKKGSEVALKFIKALQDMTFKTKTAVDNAVDTDDDSEAMKALKAKLDAKNTVKLYKIHRMEYKKNPKNGLGPDMVQDGDTERTISATEKDLAKINDQPYDLVLYFK